MAAIYQRGKIWWGRFQYKGVERRSSLETTSRSVALKRLAKWEKETKAAEWGEGAGKTYDDAMTSFLDNHVPTLRPNSQSRYEASAKALTAFFSGMALSAITSSKMAEYEAKRRREGIKPPTIRRDLACLSSMFTHTIVDLEWVEVNPVPAFLKRQKRRGRLRESPPRTRYLTQAEETALLEACFKDRDGNPIEDGQALHDAIAFAIDTGLRREEQWSLKWVQVTLTKDGGEVVIPKEIAKGKRERRVPLLPRSAQILARLPRTEPGGDTLEYVFVNRDYKRLASRNNGLRRAAYRAKLAKLTWHDLRRTCGSRLLQDYGLSLEEVRDWLGHESVQQTERAYAFLSVDALQKAVQSTAQSIGLLNQQQSGKARNRAK